MKSIAITLEDLRDGRIRATGRENGRTVIYKDGLPSEAKSLLSDVMATTCRFHRIDSGYDMEFIQLNEAAKSAIQS